MWLFHLDWKETSNEFFVAEGFNKNVIDKSKYSSEMLTRYEVAKKKLGQPTYPEQK